MEVNYLERAMKIKENGGKAGMTSSELGRRFTYADLIPEDYQNMLMQWRDIFRTGAFYIGDIANDLVKIARVKYPNDDISAQAVFEAVGVFVGKSSRMIRSYADTAKFFSKETREEFDQIPFSHFVIARSCGSGVIGISDRPSYRDILEFSLANPMVSGEYLMAKFGKVRDFEEESETSVDRRARPSGTESVTGEKEGVLLTSSAATATPNINGEITLDTTNPYLMARDMLIAMKDNKFFDLMQSEDKAIMRRAIGILDSYGIRYKV